MKTLSLLEAAEMAYAQLAECGTQIYGQVDENTAFVMKILKKAINKVKEK